MSGLGLSSGFATKNPALGIFVVQLCTSDAVEKIILFLPGGRRLELQDIINAVYFILASYRLLAARKIKVDATRKLTKVVFVINISSYGCPSFS
jgi:hypothetical protein